jgi:hypothetical protein
MRSTITVCGREIRIIGRVVRIARLEADLYHFLDDPEPMLAGLRRCATRIDVFTFMQRLPETTPKYKYFMEFDNLATLEVRSFDDWWNHQIGFKARNKAKQAEKKGVTIREIPFDEALVKGIWEIYNECPVRGERLFPHYGKSLEKVHAEEATFLDSSFFLGAFVDGTLIGFAKLTMDETGTQANLMNILSMMRHRDKASSNALIAQAVRSCAERKIAYLVYSRFAYGKKEESTFTEFKERNGFRRIDLPRYYVPLTWLGGMALRAGLHHRLIDRLPVNVANRLRELRGAWYNRRFKAVTEAS